MLFSSPEERKKLVRIFDERHGEAEEVVRIILFWTGYLINYSDLLEFLTNDKYPPEKLNLNTCPELFVVL